MRAPEALERAEPRSRASPGTTPQLVGQDRRRAVRTAPKRLPDVEFDGARLVIVTEPELPR